MKRRHYRNVIVRVALLYGGPIFALLWAGAAMAQPVENTPSAVSTTPPTLEHFVQATYPPEALASGLEAIVEFAVTVGLEGEVEEAELTDSQGHGFDEAALSAILAFRFSPALREGQPVRVRIRYRYVFELAVQRSSIVRGEVRTPSGALLPQAEIRLYAGPSEGSMEPVQSTRTDENGRYQFTVVDPGEYTLTAWSAWYDPVSRTVRLVAGETLEVRARFRHAEGVGDGVNDMYGASATIDAPEGYMLVRTLDESILTRIPGTRGDALRALEILPGVGRPSPLSPGQLIVRGAAPRDSQLFVEGAPLPVLYHFGGNFKCHPFSLYRTHSFLSGELFCAIWAKDRRHRCGRFTGARPRRISWYSRAEYS